MPPEPPDPGSAAHWLRHARSDLALAQVAPPPGALLEALCFHAQQACEKAIKALLVHAGLEVPRSHSIGALLELLPPYLAAPPDVAAAAELTEYAVEARYPSALEAVSDGELAQAVTLARTVVRWVEAQIDAGGATDPPTPATPK